MLYLKYSLSSDSRRSVSNQNSESVEAQKMSRTGNILLSYFSSPGDGGRDTADRCDAKYAVKESTASGSGGKQNEVDRAVDVIDQE